MRQLSFFIFSLSQALLTFKSNCLIYKYFYLSFPPSRESMETIEKYGFPSARE